MEKIRILVVDDHTLFRRGLIALISQASDFEVIGEAGDAIEALGRHYGLTLDRHRCFPYRR